MSLKIGVLFPNSRLYPLLGSHIVNGLRLGSKAGKASSPEVIIESTGNGASGEIVEGKAQKLILQYQADIIVAFVNAAHIPQLGRLCSLSRKPLFTCNTGANYSIKHAISPWVWHTSYDMCRSALALGYYAGTKALKKVAVATAYYESGYQISHAFSEGLSKAGGEITQWHILPFNQEIESAASYIDLIRQSKPDAIFAAFSGKNAIDFIRVISEADIPRKIPILTNGICLSDSVSRDCKADTSGMILASSWGMHLHNETNRKFVDDYKRTFGMLPDIFALPSYEIGTLLSAFDKDTLFSMMEAADLPEFFSDSLPESPRGDLSCNAEMKQLLSPVYLFENQSVGGVHQNVMIKELDAPEGEKLLTKNISGGWLNPYLCD